MIKQLISCQLLLLLMTASALRAQDAQMESFVAELMNKMTVEEKIGQLNLSTAGGFVTGAAVNDNIRQKIISGQIGAVLNSFSVAQMKEMQQLAVHESPNRIPILFGMDVIHGFRTIFPIPLAISCSWDLERIEKSARIATEEATANGICWTYSPMVDIARDARWGRIAEGSGEDPWLGSRIAEAMVRGYQGKNLDDRNTMMACVKHFALYGASEAGRDYNTVDMSRLTMYNDFLPPYRAAIDAGAGSVMTSFNLVDAVPATGNSWLLTTLLREEWQFRGFVVTDYTATNEMSNHGLGDLKTVSALALKAGTDMDMVGEGFLTTLKQSLADGSIQTTDIDNACRRVLEAKYRLGFFEDPFRYLDETLAAQSLQKPEYVAAARDLATRSIVLLKNQNQLLPLSKTGKLAVIGPLADSRPDMLGTWAMGGQEGQVVTVLEAVRKACGTSAQIRHAKGSEFTSDPMLSRAVNFFTPLPAQNATEKEVQSEELLKEALEVANQSDVVIAVLGEPAAWSGEAASRADIGIPDVQQKLLRAIVATGKPVVLVLINGRPLTLVWENEHVPAILEAWAGGQEAGNAIADVLFGHYNPSGKLTTSFPYSVGQIPVYYNARNTGRPMDPNQKFTSKYLDIPNDPLYPFGYGLSYTTFNFSEPSVSKSILKGNENLVVTVSVSNAGRFAGEEVVQLYVRDPVASVSRPLKELKAFEKVMLKPGETREVTMNLSANDLKFYNSQLEHDWEPGEFVIFTGPNSRDVKQVTVHWEK